MLIFKWLFSYSVIHLKSQIHRISCFPYRHFERSEKSSLHSVAFLLPSQKVSPFPLSHIRRYTGVQERSRASLGMTLREYRSLTLPIYFPCNNDTREAPSTFAALLFFMRRTTPLNPTTWTLNPQQKSPSKSQSFFVSERLICQTARAWCLLLLQYQ